MTTVDPLLDYPAPLQPLELRRNAEKLRRKARRCSDLAQTSITEEGRSVLLTMSEQFESEATGLEQAVLALRQLYSSAIEELDSA